MGNKATLSTLFAEACLTDAALLDHHYQSVDWRSDQAPEQIRAHFNKNAQTLWEACIDLSSEIERAPLTVLRNALARRLESPPDGSVTQPYDRVKAYYVTLIFLKEIVDQPDAIDSILKEVQRPTTTAQAALSALNRSWPPSQTALNRMLKASPHAQARALLSLRPIRTREQLVKHLKQLTSSPLHQDATSAVQIIAESGPSNRPKLNQAMFESLPKQTKALILSDGICRDGLLDKTLLNKVDKDPLVYIEDPRSEEYVQQLCDKAIASIRDSDYRSDAVARLVETEWKFLKQHDCIKTFLQSVDSNIRENYRDTIRKLPQAISGTIAKGWPNQPAVIALRLAFAVPRKRSELINRLPANIIAHGRWASDYIMALPTKERLGTLLALTRRRNAQEKIGDWVLEHFARWKLPKNASTDLLAIAFCHASPYRRDRWIEEAEQNDIDRLISHTPAAADLWLNELLEHYPPQTAVESRRHQWVIDLLKNSPPNTPWPLVSGAKKTLQKKFIELAIDALLKDTSTIRNAFRQCLLLQPGVLRHIIRQQSTQNKARLIHLVIQNALEIPSATLKATGVLELPYRDLSPSIAEAFPNKKLSQETLHVLSQLPKDVQAKFVLDYPNACFCFAEHSLSDRDLLSLAYRYKNYRELADERLTFKQRIHHIEWARESDQPLTSLSKELATVLKPRFFEYYRELAEHWYKRIKEDIAPGHRFDDLYRTYDLPKRHGGKRTICVPYDHLKRIQRDVLDSGLERMSVHPAAHGFRKGCSIVSNASQHVGRKVVVNVDIRGFFPNTRFHLIYGVFKQFMDGLFSSRACFFLADLCSYQAGLPTGAPTSPAIGNLILRSADASISKAAHRNGITYTRYADDLTFSGGDHTPKILPFVEKVLSDYDYELDPAKRGIFRKGRQQPVTGLLVNEKANLTRRRRRRLRAAVHHRRSGRTPTWHGKPLSDRELLGHLAFLNMVQPEEAASLQKQLKACMGEETE